MQSLIDQMTAALAQLDAQREALTAAIAALQGTSGPPPKNLKAPRAAKARPAPRRGRRGRTEAASVGETPARPRTASRDSAILTTLQGEADGLGVGEIASRLRLTVSTASYQLRKLLAAQQVTATGMTSQRRYRLAG